MSDEYGDEWPMDWSVEACAELDKKDEQIEKLNSTLDKWTSGACRTKRIAALEASNQRLREALNLIISNKRESPSYCLDPKVGLSMARSIARKALEQK